MPMDWKEALGALSAQNFPDAPDDGHQAETADAPKKKLPHLHIGIDRRQRKGKTATIIEGFDCDDAELKAIAASLKSALGTGGSSRCGEILLQGDWRGKAADLLRAKGYKTTII